MCKTINHENGYRDDVLSAFKLINNLNLNLYHYTSIDMRNINQHNKIYINMENEKRYRLIYVAIILNIVLWTRFIIPQLFDIFRNSIDHIENI